MDDVTPAMRRRSVPARSCTLLGSNFVVTTWEDIRQHSSINSHINDLLVPINIMEKDKNRQKS